ncbi:hypothetical protein [Promicromonospora sp. NFX87]|uniref:hypothetical protein n=1 Tax=Promicromonospora sp. NFX87 TaxID=3402691 RepID=UPI003AFA0D90
MILISVLPIAGPKRDHADDGTGSTPSDVRQASVNRLRIALSAITMPSGASAPAPAHAFGVNQPECRCTRAAIRDYLAGRLLPRRRGCLEAHLYECAECIRALTDVREAARVHRGRSAVAAGRRIARRDRPPTGTT